MSPLIKGQPIPIPVDLRRELPDPLIPWGISEGVFKQMQAQEGSTAYRKVQVLPTDPEWRFVWRYFHHDKPTKYALKNIFCVHERSQVQAFELNLLSLERESDKFGANWEKEPRVDQRVLAIRRWQNAVASFSPFNTMESDGRRKEWRKAKVLPLWHGSSKEVCHSISESGFVYFGKTSIGQGHAGDPKSTDEGYFGSGIYFTNSARYAADIYSTGHLLLAWVSMREPFPVVGDLQQQDMKTLMGKGAYKHYNAHYIPVVPQDSDPSCAIYYPCKQGEEPVCDELVVFQKSQAVPRFLVELEVELPYLINPSAVPQFVNELIPHLLKMLQNPEVDKDQKLRNILGSELAILLTLSGDDYLEEKHEVLFKQMTELLDQTGKVNKVVVKTLMKGPQAMSLQAPSPTVSTSSAKLEAEREEVKRAEETKRAEKVRLEEAKRSAVLKQYGCFGAAQWETYFGDIGAEPPLPPDILEILTSPCPIWSGKKIGETHLLVLIPETVNGEALTFNRLGELIKCPKQGHSTQYIRIPINR